MASSSQGDPTQLPLRDLLGLLRDGSLGAEELARAFLDRIESLDAPIRAWAHVDPERVLADARALDALAVARRGDLHGIPVGVKDIFDTADLPTEYGTPIYAGHRPVADAAVVALARRQGMLVLGKTVTTEFATWAPGPTANPHDLSRTPGGSSSGSAAAVSTGMAPVAFATQTTGSTIRPAAFCGVVGYKPTFGLLPTLGVKAISESFDTIGVMTRSVADAALVVAVLSGRPLAPPAGGDVPRLGIARTYEWPSAAAETEALFAELPERLARDGGRPLSRELPRAFEGIADAQSTIWVYEIARCLAYEHRHYRDRVHVRLRDMLDEGAAMSVDEYDAAQHRLHRCQAALEEAFAGVDVLVVPSAPGEAPPIETTGYPIFNRVWSALGVPAVNVPAGRGPLGLPLGVQVVGRPGDDRRVLECAAWVESALAGKR